MKKMITTVTIMRRRRLIMAPQFWQNNLATKFQSHLLHFRNTFWKELTWYHLRVSSSRWWRWLQRWLTTVMVNMMLAMVMVMVTAMVMVPTWAYDRSTPGQRRCLQRKSGQESASASTLTLALSFAGEKTCSRKMNGNASISKSIGNRWYLWYVGGCKCEIGVYPENNYHSRPMKKSCV